MSYVDHDSSGVPVRQLQKLLKRAITPLKTKTQLVASSVLAPSALTRIQREPKNAVINLKLADKILIALGHNIGHLVAQGEVNVVHLDSHRKNAVTMAEDEFWAKDLEWTDIEVTTRADELMREKQEVLYGLLTWEEKQAKKRAQNAKKRNT